MLPSSVSSTRKEDGLILKREKENSYIILYHHDIYVDVFSIIYADVIFHADRAPVNLHVDTALKS